MPTPDIPGYTIGAPPATPTVTFDGQGSTPTAGTTFLLNVPYGGQIKSVTISGDVSGSAVVDIWVAPYPTVPTIGNTITASAKPTLSSQQVNQDTTLTGWTKTIMPDSNIIFRLDSASTLTRVTVILEVVV